MKANHKLALRVHMCKEVAAPIDSGVSLSQASAESLKIYSSDEGIHFDSSKLNHERSDALEEDLIRCFVLGYN